MMLYYLSNQESGMTLYIQQPTNSTENPQSPGCPLGGEKTEPAVADVEAGVEA